IAAAAGGARLVPRMADDELPGSLPACVQAHSRHARRQGLRLHLEHAHAWNRPGRLDDRSPLRTGLRETGPQPGKVRAHDGALRETATWVGATHSILIAVARGRGQWTPSRTSRFRFVTLIEQLNFIRRWASSEAPVCTKTKSFSRMQTDRRLLYSKPRHR